MLLTGGDELHEVVVVTEVRPHANPDGEQEAKTR